MVAHACNPSSWEAEAEGSQIQSQSRMDDIIIDIYSDNRWQQKQKWKRCEYPSADT